MRNRTYTTRAALALLAAVFALTSCIREDLQPCPPLSIHLGVADKNYDNIDFIEEQTGLDHRLPEDLPFRQYVPKLFYLLYDLDRQEAVTVRHLHDVQGDAPLATVYDIPQDLPFGRYALLVWGNILSEDGILADGRLNTYDLHRDHVEGYDLYMACDTLVYDEWNYDYTVNLHRVKGKLLIEGRNLPEHVCWSRKAVSNLSGNIDHTFAYDFEQPEYVVTETDWSHRPAATVVTDTYLAPTVPGEESTVYVRFFDSPDMQEPVATPRNVNITMRRNEITVLRYDYDPGTGEFTISILLNDGWSVLHEMGIE